jgi:excisionase family DNA binding protein
MHGSTTTLAAPAASDLIRVQEIPVAASVDEAAHLLRICRTNVYPLIAAGELKSFILGRRRLITGESIARLMRSRQQAEYTPTCDAPRRDDRLDRKRK